jgi:hypothetical protein
VDKVDKEDKEDKVDKDTVEVGVSGSEGEVCVLGDSVMEQKGNFYKYLIYHNNRGYISSSYNPCLICSLHYNPG